MHWTSCSSHGLGVDGDLASTLAGKRSLLVLDNLEQVIDSARELGELLAACHELGVVATSREPLHLSGEHEYPLAPMPEDAGRSALL